MLTMRQAYGAYLVDLGQQTFIDGDVQGEKTRSVILRDGTVVGGNFQITEAVAPEDVDALLVNNAEVRGDVQAEQIVQFTNGQSAPPEG